jgi:hypothetical protein
VREEGGEILLVEPTNSDKLTTDERITHIPPLQRPMGPNREPLERGIALDVRAASENVHPRWTTPDGSGDAGAVSQRSIEAQIAAAVTGRKPLYFEPWGEGLSQEFATAYRAVIPADVEVHARDGNLFIYRINEVIPILEADSQFYQKAGDSILDSVARVSATGQNGELLGYGARSLLERPAQEVRIFKGKDLFMYYFVSDSDSEHAARFAAERATDFELAFGWDDVRFELNELK